MTQKPFLYQFDYYHLFRREQEDQVVRLLNNDAQLLELTNVPIRQIVDKLASVVMDAQLTVAGDTVLVDEVAINERLITVLKNNPAIAGLDKIAILENLFSHALSTLQARLFDTEMRHSDTYVIQTNIISWLEDMLARTICEDIRFMNAATLMRVLRQADSLHHFYRSLKAYIPDGWISEQANAWTTPAENLANIEEHFRTVDRDFLDSYKARISKLGKLTPWRYVFEGTRYSDHLMFDTELSFKSSLLLQRNKPMWIKFWDNLELTLLQDVPFHYIAYPSIYLEIATALAQNHQSLKTDPKVLAHILLKNIFESSIEVHRRLSFYIDSQRIDSLSHHEKDPEIISSGQAAYSTWQGEKLGIYQQMIQILSAIIDEESIEEWLFSYKPKSGPVNQHTEQYNQEVSLLVRSYREKALTNSFEVALQKLSKDFNLQRFNYVITQYHSEGLNDQQVDACLNLLQEFTASNKFFWDHSFDPFYWNTLKSVGFLLSEAQNPVNKAKTLLENVRVHHEGWNIQTDNYNLTSREAFFICGACLLFDYPQAFHTPKDSSDYFESLLNLTIRQLRFMTSSLNDNYRAALTLLSMIVDQVLPETSEYYQTELITKVDELGMMLVILANGKSSLTKTAKNLLEQRVESELPIARKKQRRIGSTELIDKCLRILQIE